MLPDRSALIDRLIAEGRLLAVLKEAHALIGLVPGVDIAAILDRLEDAVADLGDMPVLRRRVLTLMARAREQAEWARWN